jgi:branched-chain amino acid transport system permease protein
LAEVHLVASWVHFAGRGESLGTGFFPDPDRALAYTQAFGALLLILTLLIRPTGLFGRPHARLE